MFEQSTLPSGPASKRVWATSLGVTGQALLVGFAILAPMVWPQVLPHAMLATTLLPPVPPGRPKAPEHERLPVVKVKRTDFQYRAAVLFQPTSIPIHPAVFIDPPPDEPTGPYVVGAPNGSGVPGDSTGVIGGLLRDGAPSPAAPRPIANARPVEAAPPAGPIRVKVGGRVKMAEVVHRVEPQYPQLARQMHVGGVVELVGVIGIDGHLKELRVVNGHPLLARAALDAVSQWIYTPTTLNGDPVEIIAPITVTFKLN